MNLLLCKNKPADKTALLLIKNKSGEGIEFVIKLPGANLQVFLFLRE